MIYYTFPIYFLHSYHTVCIFRKYVCINLDCMPAHGHHSTMEVRGQAEKSILSSCRSWLGHLAHSPFVLKTQIFNTSSVWPLTCDFPALATECQDQRCEPPCLDLFLHFYFNISVFNLKSPHFILSSRNPKFLPVIFVVIC